MKINVLSPVYFFLVVVPVALASALTSGRVTPTLSVLKEAPITVSLLAWGPSVRVLAQPTLKKATAAINNVTFVFFI
jgi:hypothetical protein